MGLHTRRQFFRSSLALAGLGLVSGCGVVALPWQQPPQIPRIGWLGLTLTDSGTHLLRDDFRQGLRERGWVEGENIDLEFRSAEGQSARLPALARELVVLRPAVIVAAGGSSASHALQGATDTIPIVFATVGDPVGQ